VGLEKLALAYSTLRINAITRRWETIKQLLPKKRSKLSTRRPRLGTLTQPEQQQRKPPSLKLATGELVILDQEKQNQRPKLEELLAPRSMDRLSR